MVYRLGRQEHCGPGGSPEGPKFVAATGDARVFWASLFGNRVLGVTPELSPRLRLDVVPWDCELVACCGCRLLVSFFKLGEGAFNIGRPLGWSWVGVPKPEGKSDSDESSGTSDELGQLFTSGGLST